MLRGEEGGRGGWVKVARRGGGKEEGGPPTGEWLAGEEGIPLKAKWGGGEEKAE